MESAGAGPQATESVLAALQADKVVDLTSSLKLASGLPATPQTASSGDLPVASTSATVISSSLSVKACLQSQHGAVLLQSFENNEAWTYYGKKGANRTQVAVSAPSRDEAEKIKHWRAEKAAIKERAAQTAAAKQV